MESLEDRKLLAGNVAVSLRGGLVTITGDNNSQNISIYQQANGRFNIIGNDGEVFTGPTTNLQVRNLTANLNGGDDIFTVSAQPDPLAPDTVPAQILGTTTVNGGVGADTMNVSVIGRLASTLLIPAVSITVNGGDELASSPDTVFITNSAAALVTVNTWAGNDYIVLRNDYAVTLNVNAGVPVTPNGGTDNDSVVALGVTAVTGVFSLGTASSTEWGNNLRVETGLYGNLIVDGGAGQDIVSIFNILAGATLTVTTLGGNDSIDMHAVHTGMTQADYQAVAVHLTAAFGVDITRLPFNLFGLINSLPTLPGVLTISTGDGNDGVSISNIDSTLAIYVFLDRGDDQLRATTINALYSYYFGGPGFDRRLLTAIDGFFLELQFEDILLPPAG